MLMPVVPRAHPKGRNAGGQPAGAQPPQQQQQQKQAAPSSAQAGGEVAEYEDEEGVIYLDGVDEEEEDEEGVALFQDKGEGDADDDGGGWLDDDDLAWGEGGGEPGAAPPDEQVRPGAVSAGGAPWGDAALAAAAAALEGGGPAMAHLRLYSARCSASPARIDVRLDKLTDVYGSPSLDDIEAYSRRLASCLEASLGPDEAGQIVIEVSSPGAERELLLPGDLARFGALPLRVEFDAARAELLAAAAGGGKKGGGKKTSSGGSGGGGEPPAAAAGAAAAAQQQQQQQQQGQQQAQGQPAGSGLRVEVLELTAYDEAAGMTEWVLADVRANAPGKGRGLSRRQREQRWRVPVDALLNVRVHVDF